MSCLTVLDTIEATLGESRRHQVEHDLNIGRTALAIFLRAGPTHSEPGFASAYDLRWVLGWMVAIWSFDCISIIADGQGSVPDDVLDTVFTDLHEAVTELYQVASEVYDAGES